MARDFRMGCANTIFLKETAIGVFWDKLQDEEALDLVKVALHELFVKNVFGSHLDCK